MTDEQLRAMARRVLGLVTEVVHDERPCYVGYADGISFTQPADDIEAAAVAILREEMDREWMAANHLDDDIDVELATRAIADYEAGRWLSTEDYIAELLRRDPTQTIVIDT